MTAEILPAPPLGRRIVRTSALEIEISWNAVVDNDSSITGYVVKYRPVTTLQRRNSEALAVVLETNQTNLVISGLDPRLSYGVSMAAKNRAGFGNFTEEVIIQCKH